jgi:ADP-ribose pyrophosphatase YjhB (NUDIX family)
MVNLFAIALLYVGDTVLLLHRHNTDFGNGLFGLPGGKVEQGETARQAISREIEEELGLHIPASTFELVHTFHRKGTETEFVALCFKADITGLHPVNNEPEKHDDMAFFNISKLPENIIPAHAQAIKAIAQNINYSEHGW